MFRSKMRVQEVTVSTKEFTLRMLIFAVKGGIAKICVQYYLDDAVLRVGHEIHRSRCFSLLRDRVRTAKRTYRSGNYHSGAIRRQPSRGCTSNQQSAEFQFRFAPGLH